VAVPQPSVVPFTLPGASAAQLVVVPKRAQDITGATRVRVLYGDGSASSCIALQQRAGRVFGSTSVPPTHS